MAAELRYHPNSLVVGLISVQIHLKYRRECQGCCLWLKDVECYHLNDVFALLDGRELLEASSILVVFSVIFYVKNLPKFLAARLNSVGNLISMA